jgi:hypothetical protein
LIIRLRKKKDGSKTALTPNLRKSFSQMCSSKKKNGISIVTTQLGGFFSGNRCIKFSMMELPGRRHPLPGFFMKAYPDEKSYNEAKVFHMGMFINPMLGSVAIDPLSCCKLA